MEHYVFDNLFVQSLEGDAFVWYSKLPPGLKPFWDSLVARFHKHFYSTHRSVGVTEFSEAKQRQHFSVFDSRMLKTCISYLMEESAGHRHTRPLTQSL